MSDKKYKDHDMIALHSTEHKPGLVVANVLAKVVDGKLRVNIINLCDHDVTLNQSSRLCTASRWYENETHAVNVRESEMNKSGQEDWCE